MNTATITFIAGPESKGNLTDPATMDYFQGRQYPWLSVVIPELSDSYSVVDWTDLTVNWQEKQPLVLGPVWG